MIEILMRSDVECVVREARDAGEHWGTTDKETTR